MGQGKAHFPGRMIGDKAYRIDGFPGGSRSHQHLFPCQILLAGNFLQNIFQQQPFVGHSSVAAVPIGQHTGLRRNDLIAEADQLLQIILDDRVVVHIVIHGRGNDFLTGAGHDRSSQHIVSNAVRDLANHVGRGRSHQHHVRLLCQRHMLHAVLEIPVKGVNEAFIAGKLFEGQRCDEFRGVFRHQYLYIGAQFLQHPRQIYDFICSDTAGHRQHRGLSF